MDIRQRHREWRGFVQVVVMSALCGVQGQAWQPKITDPTLLPAIRVESRECGSQALLPIDKIHGSLNDISSVRAFFLIMVFAG